MLLRSRPARWLHLESDDEYSDDDDMSWKVRRASIKCLDALMGSRRDLLRSFYSSICPALLARFKEREENVRADVFAAFSTLLRQTRAGPTLLRGGEEEPAVAMLRKQVHATVAARTPRDRPGFNFLSAVCPGAGGGEGSSQAAEGEEHQIPTGLLLSPHGTGSHRPRSPGATSTSSDTR